jgi:hypothetical protein
MSDDHCRGGRPRPWPVPVAVAVVTAVVAGVVVAGRAGAPASPPSSAGLLSSTVDRPFSAAGGALPRAGAASSAGGSAVGAIPEGPDGHRIRLTAELARRRTAAFRAGDEAAWLADIDPAASRVIARERMRFANLRQFRFASIDWRPRDYSTGFSDERDLATGRVVVDQIMQLAQDVERSKNTVVWTLAFTGGRVVITAIDAATGPSTDQGASRHQPWDDVPLRSARGAGVQVVAPAGGRWNPKTYVPAAERAARLVRSLWRRRLGVPGFIVFLADEQHFASWFNAGSRRRGAAGITAFPPMVEPDGRERTARPNPAALHRQGDPSWLERGAGSRIVLDMTQLAGTREVQTVLAHEMAHATGPHLIEATRAGPGRNGAGNQAVWPIEGFARWVEFLDQPAYGPYAMRGVRTARARYRPAGPFPSGDGFYSPDGDRTSFNYNLSASLFLAAARSGGQQKAVDLYICLTGRRELTAATEAAIDVCVGGVGLDSRRVWARQHRLVA